MFTLADYFTQGLRKDFRGESIAKHETAILESKSLLTSTLLSALQDLDLLRSELEKALIDNPDVLFNHKTVNKLHANFILTRPNAYDHVRLIGVNGQELLRVNDRNGKVEFVPPDKLQNKKDRYYFTETLATQQGHAYVSPIDLNVENNEIQMPLNPVMRIGTPLFVQGNQMGISIINLSFAHMIQHMREIGARVDKGVWLVNADGYWLLGNQPEEEWGFVFHDRTGANLKTKESLLWKQMSTGEPHGTFDSGRGIYTYERVQLESLASQTRLIPDQLENHWYVVSFTDRIQLDEFNKALNALVTPSFFAIWIFVSALCIWLGYAIQKRSEVFRDLQQSEAHLNSIFEHAPDAVVISNIGGFIQYINYEAENLFGYARANLIGKPIETLIPKRLKSDHAHYRQSYIQQPRRREMGEGADLVAVHQSGSEIPVKISLNYIESTKGNYVIANVRDITAEIELQKSRREQEQMFSQQSKMAAMGEMVAAIAHQWKQPLNVLSGVLMNIQDSYNRRMLARHYLDQQMQIADNNLQYMSSTIDDFSTFLNPTSTTDRFLLSKAFEGAQRLTDAQLKYQGIRLKMTDSDRQIEIQGSKSEFIQVLISLINNAKDAIVSSKIQNQHAGTISITPHIEDGSLIIDVADDGCGISDEIADKIFEPYFSTKQRQTNTGIGLYLTRTILHKKFDTQLSLVQQGQQGARFRITVPSHKFKML